MDCGYNSNTFNSLSRMSGSAPDDLWAVGPGGELDKTIWYYDGVEWKAYREKYPGTIMLPYNNVDVKDLGKIADYLLTK